jgi:hypothetical protein
MSSSESILSKYGQIPKTNIKRKVLIFVVKQVLSLYQLACVELCIKKKSDASFVPNVREWT